MVRVGTARPPGPPAGSSTQPGVHKPIPVPRGSPVLPSASWEGHPRPSRPTSGHAVKPCVRVGSPGLGQAGGGERSPRHLGFPCRAHRCRRSLHCQSSGVSPGKKEQRWVTGRKGAPRPGAHRAPGGTGRVAPCVQPQASSSSGLPGCVRLDKQHFPPEFQLIPTQAMGIQITQLFRWPG